MLPTAGSLGPCFVQLMKLLALPSPGPGPCEYLYVTEGRKPPFDVAYAFVTMPIWVRLGWTSLMKYVWTFTVIATRQPSGAAIGRMPPVRFWANTTFWSYTSGWM